MISLGVFMKTTSQKLSS
ncbi:hypothetical protein F383_10010 [Gossypium arboreum]|uniref:Uncharacterized protein n=1 Tax=Gossypium arboreum TaxID=29729 RepID=A0A0B0PXU5_GOSAR|nr:hypothetical protein F383_10010 [Gossypium arboreum]